MAKQLGGLRAASENGWIARHRALYQEDGEAGHMWDSTEAGGPGPLPTLLLTTRGRKSGRESVMPLLYGEVADGYAIIASRGGAPQNPGWFYNLLEQPQVKVQIRNDTFMARHRIATGLEREAIWKQMATMYPPYEDYQQATSREIPVIVLEPEQA